MSDDGDAGFVPEGQPIDELVPDFFATVITTGKVAALGKFSREALLQPNAARLIVNSVQRAVTKKADVAFLSNVTSPTGLLEVTGIGDGGAVGLNLDAVADAITDVEADSGTVSRIIAAPDALGTLAKIKSGTESEQSLLGAGTEQAERRLLSVPVLTTSAMPAGTLLVLDSSQVLAVHGQVQMARSDDVFFTSEVVAVRLMWRVGFAVMRPARIVSLTTGA